MAAAPLLLAIDQGTTSTRAMVFDSGGTSLGSHQIEFAQHFPADGWVEHDPEEIWRTTVTACRTAIEAAGTTPEVIAALGITNQRETTVLWERASGKPIANAIVWQDRRTAPLCRQLVEDGHEPDIQARTGLLIDAYFSASKLEWLLDNVDGARQAAEAGDLAFGTIDSFLLWRLTGGKVHATDATNASRTMLFNIHTQEWDRELLARFNVPRKVLPDVRDSAGDFGATDPDILGAAIPVRGIAGDQQAALVGQACFSPGMVKSTYGTGCFVLANTGATAVASENRMLTTVACRLDGKVTYALEGSIFIAGAAVQWLRDGLGLIASAAETEQLARDARDSSGVVMVPAFVGLGAPWWDPDARGAILGLTRDSGRAEIVRATLDAVCFQTRDLLEAMSADGAAAQTLRVDGGMIANDWLAQRLADLTGLPIERPAVTETAALGAAYLAGIGGGVFGSVDEIAGKWQQDRGFSPKMDSADRDAAHAKWKTAVARVRSG